MSTRASPPHAGRRRARRLARLVRWLGPWAGAAHAPAGIRRLELALATPSGPVRCYRYEPTACPPEGVYVVAQGLHYAGPDDPRMDRFCRVLAHAGFVVLAPFLRPYLELCVAPSAADDFAAAVGAGVALAEDLGLPPPALFSISFGSTPALSVAASDALAECIGAVIVFGGFADFAATVRFAVSGRAFDGDSELCLPHDPLNGPAVFINLLPHLATVPHRSALAAAWHRMARRTWGRPVLRPAEERAPIAAAIAAELPAAARPLFHIGCGLAPGACALLEEGLARGAGAFGHTDPAPHLARLRAPVLVAHGRDDDVIPFVEAAKLYHALPCDHPRQLTLTGLFGHTGAVVPSLAALRAELAATSELLGALADAPCGRWRPAPRA